MLHNTMQSNSTLRSKMDRRWTRREMLKYATLAGLAVPAMGWLLAGCNFEQRLEERRAEREAAAEEDDPQAFPELEPTEINGVELAVWDSGGDGDPVVFIHGAASMECMPILIEPALTDQFRLIYYHRRGWGESPQADAPTTMQERAADCVAVMEHFGIDRAHIEGQSAGGAIALQVASEYPESVQSLALLEPALPTILDHSEQFMGAIGGLIPYFEEGDYEAVAEGFAIEVIGEEYIEIHDQNMPDGAFEQWASEMETLFLYDIPGQEGWTFTDEMADQIDHPVLNMTGADAEPYWDDVHARIAEMLPQAENVVLPDAPHVMLGTNPSGAAQQLAAFFARHPID